MNLTRYERYKQDLAALLRSQALGDHAYTIKRDDIAGRLAQDKFNLVTAGRFSRGKSTLMNALLRTNLLPTGIVPLTSVITVVKYGSVPQATLYYRDTSLFMNIGLDELAAHLTEYGNPGNREGISRAEIELPSALLRYGFCFVDTPGLNSAIIENTRTTLDFLPQASAILVVTSFDSALSAEEMDLLRQAQKAAKQVFLVVNKADLVDALEREAVLHHIAKRLQCEDLQDVKIFPVCAIAAMRQEHCADIDDLRRAIIRFCVAAGQNAVLAEIADDLKALLTQAGDDEGLRQLAVLTSQRVAWAENEEELEPVDAPPRRSCPVCGALKLVAFQALSGLQFQLSHSVDQREAFAKGPGLCRVHAVLFGKIANPLAVAQGLAESLDKLATRLDPQGHDPVPGDCCICQLLQAAESQEIDQQAAREPDEAALICLTHLPRLLASLPQGKRALVSARITRHYQRLAEDLRRFALLREGAKRGLISAEENRAAGDVIDTLAGQFEAWWLDL